MSDPVNHPVHYTNGPTCPHCGNTLEAITFTEHFGFNLGNAMKYIWRCALKGKKHEDLEKAMWYMKRAYASSGDEELQKAIELVQKELG